MGQTDYTTKKDKKKKSKFLQWLDRVLEALFWTS